MQREPLSNERLQRTRPTATLWVLAAERPVRWTDQFEICRAMYGVPATLPLRGFVGLEFTPALHNLRA